MEGEDGQWTHPDSGATGHWDDDGTFVNDTAGQSYDPNTGEVTDQAAAQTGAPDPAGQVQPGQTPQERIQDWGWEDRGNGQWFHPETGSRGRFQSDGTFYNTSDGKVWDPTSGHISDYEAPPVRPGEFLERNPNRFNDPGQIEPFSFDEVAEGYNPFNRQFSFDIPRQRSRVTPWAWWARARRRRAV